MLPSSIRKLSKQFNISAGDKGIFPYKFVLKDNLDYAGSVPEFKYFMPPGGIGITEMQYNHYASNYKYRLWNLRDETELYCNQDCLVLYEVLLNFFKENFIANRINASRQGALSM